jgi:hypothetical protein
MSKKKAHKSENLRDREKQEWSKAKVKKNHADLLLL